MYRVFHKPILHSIAVNIYADDSVIASDFREVRRVCFMGKTIVVTESFSSEPENILTRAVHTGTGLNMGATQKVFVSSSCKLPRALIRNAGYKITIDKDNAEKVIIPEPVRQYVSKYFMIGYYKDDDGIDNVILIHFRRKYYSMFSWQYSNNLIEKIKLEIREKVERDVDFFYSENFKDGIKLISLNECQEYADILQHYDRSFNRTKYVYESDVKLNPAININTETLVTWQSGLKSNERLIEKAIINSDWRKYPYTLYKFLKAELRGENYDNFIARSSGHFKQIASELERYCYNINREKMTISKQDYDMLFAWIAYQAGVSEKGGYVEQDKFDRIQFLFGNQFKHAVCIKPITFENEIPLSEFDSLCNCL